jgi:hypothetical protein
MSRPAEMEVEREARRILRRLAAPRAVLFARGADYALARSAAAAAGSRLGCAMAFVEAFVRKGWITADGPGRFVLAQEGHAFLVRSLGGPDSFAQQHREMQDHGLGAEDGNRMVQVNIGESPLGRLKARDLVDGTQFAAGERMRRDYTLAQLTPRMGVDLSAPVVSGGRGGGADSISDIAVAARQRFSRAMAAAGPGLSDLAFEVCCDLVSLERAEGRRGWNKRSGRVVLCLALDRLAAHYGMNVTRKYAPIRACSFEEAG